MEQSESEDGVVVEAKKESLTIINDNEKYSLEKNTQLPGFKQGISYIRFSDKDQSLAIGYQTGGIRIYDVERHDYLAEFEIPKIKEIYDYDYDPNEIFYPITCIRWLNLNNVFCSSGDGSIKLWNLKETDMKKKLKAKIMFEGTGINALDISPDKDILVAGGMDHNLHIYDTQTMKETMTYRGEDAKHCEHFNRIYSILIDPTDPNIFYSGGWDKCIVTHDLREKHAVSRFMGPYIAGDSLDIYGETLLAGSYRSQDPLEIYDLRVGEVLKTIRWDETDKKGGMIMSCQFGNPASDTVIAGSSSDHELKLFDKNKDKTLCTVNNFSGPVVAIHLDHQGKNVACGTKTGVTVLLKYNDGTYIDEGEDN